MGVRQTGQWIGPDTSVEEAIGSNEADDSADGAVAALPRPAAPPPLPPSIRRGFPVFPICAATVATKNSRSVGDIWANCCALTAPLSVSTRATPVGSGVTLASRVKLPVRPALVPVPDDPEMRERNARPNKRAAPTRARRPAAAPASKVRAWLTSFVNKSVISEGEMRTGCGIVDQQQGVRGLPCLNTRTVFRHH
jgi:hypothetical protein